MSERLNVVVNTGIVYIYGTVNGVESTWTAAGNGVWQTTVPKSVDGYYHIDITAYDAAENQTHYQTTVCRFDDLRDVKTSWGPNDYLNYADMNKIEANISFVKDKVEQLVGPFDFLIIKTDRTIVSFDFAADLNRIENNIAVIADNFVQPIGWLTPKTDWQGNISSISYLDIIRMEHNLKLLYELIIKTIDALPYCGEYYCGEDVI